MKRPALLLCSCPAAARLRPADRTGDDAGLGAGGQGTQLPDRPRRRPAGESFVGTVESSARGILAARIDGQVTQILVKEGDAVKAGQLLLVLGDNLAGDQLRQAEAGLAQAQEGAATAQAQLTLAEKTYARYRQLFEKQAITPQEMDQMTANLEVAKKAGVGPGRGGPGLPAWRRPGSRPATARSRPPSPAGWSANRWMSAAR